MTKRLSDLAVSLIQLVIAMPILLLIALAIRLDSPGPIWYHSPRLGRGGTHFGMVRFRTVDIHRPATLPINKRLTRVGRFIRNYSLDDLPNLFNIVLGDLSTIGPRPMEPDLVDLTDPVWRQILSVRPGIVSPAILQLGATYNTTPVAVKQQLEVAYVQRQSLLYDLQLFWRGIQRFITTKGNFKRGAPRFYTTSEDDR